MKIKLVLQKMGFNVTLEGDSESAESMSDLINLREAFTKNGWKFTDGSIEDTEQAKTDKANQSGQ